MYTTSLLNSFVFSQSVSPNGPNLKFSIPSWRILIEETNPTVSKIKRMELRLEKDQWCLFSSILDVFLVHFRSPSNDSEGNVFLRWVAKSNGLRGRLVLQGFCLYIHKVWRSSLLTCRPFDGHYQSQQRSTHCAHHCCSHYILRVVTLEWIKADVGFWKWDH